jgi:phosphatidylinositol kinase/protein kinase (PI-3  family)
MRSRWSTLRFDNLLRRYIVKLFVLRLATTLLNIFLTNYAYLKRYSYACALDNFFTL